MSTTPPSSPSSNSRIIPISPLTPLVYDTNNYARSSNEHDGIPLTNDDDIARQNDKKILEAHLTRIDEKKQEIKRRMELMESLKTASPGFIQQSKLGLDIQQLIINKKQKRKAEEQQAYQPYDNPEQFWMSNSTEKQKIINMLDEEIQNLEAEYGKIIEYIKKTYRDEAEKLRYGKKTVKKGGKKSKKNKKSRVRKTNKRKGRNKK